MGSARVTAWSSAGNDGACSAPGASVCRALPRGSALGAPPTPGDWPRSPEYVVARRYAVSGTAPSRSVQAGPSNGADDPFTVQDHSQGRACGASVLRTADP